MEIKCTKKTENCFNPETTYNKKVFFTSTPKLSTNLKAQTLSSSKILYLKQLISKSFLFEKWSSSLFDSWILMQYVGLNGLWSIIILNLRLRKFFEYVKNQGLYYDY